MGDVVVELAEWARTMMNLEVIEDYGNRCGLEVYQDGQGHEVVIETFDFEPQRVIRDGQSIGGR